MVARPQGTPDGGRKVSPLPRWERVRACPGLEPGVRVQGDKKGGGASQPISAICVICGSDNERDKISQKSANPCLTYPLLMYHNNNQAPKPLITGTGAQKYRRVEGKRTFYEGYRQSNNETPVCGRDNTGSLSITSLPKRSATVPARS